VTLTSTKTIKVMAESVDNSSSEGSEISDFDEVSSSELRSTSSEGSSEEESCSRGKGKGPAKTAKTSKSNVMGSSLDALLDDGCRGCPLCSS